MSRLFNISKKFAHGFILIQLCLIGLGILLLVAVIKAVDTLWRLLVSSFKKTPKLYPSSKEIESPRMEHAPTLAAPAQRDDRPKEPQVQMPFIERYQSNHPADYDEFEDEADFEDKPERPLISIEILRRDEAQEPNMPSTFFPGCGSDGAQFKVLGEERPLYEEISGALYRWADDSCLIRYEAETGVGYFSIVDGEAPEAGSVIDLA